MARHGEGIAYDERSGLKVRGSKLRQDYYTKSWTTDPDGPHPQDFVRPPGPDGLNRQYGPKAQHSIPCTDLIGVDFFNTATMRHVHCPALSINPGYVLESA